MLAFVLSIVATIAFAILIQIPRRAIVPVGTLGAIAWMFLAAGRLYGMSDVVASFIASIVVSLLSEAYARWFRMPVTIFTVPGILVLVPGMSAYLAMRAFVLKQYVTGLALGTETALEAGAIASGLVIAGVLARSVWRKRDERSIRSPL